MLKQSERLHYKTSCKKLIVYSLVPLAVLLYLSLSVVRRRQQQQQQQQCPLCFRPFHHTPETDTGRRTLPRWERPRQFLDDVDVYKPVNDIDPLTWKFSVLPPDKTGSMRNVHPNVQPIVFKTASSERGFHPKLNRNSSKFKQKHKRILVMNSPGWDWLRMGNTSLENCPVGCTLTTNIKEFQTADAVIFYAVYMYLKKPVRPPEQVWIFFSLETPVYSMSQTFKDPNWHNEINWTMSYRTDSDIWYPYGRINRRTNILTTNYTAVAAKKSKQATWFVSHCSTNSSRESYVAELNRYIQVDTYGACGKTSAAEGSFEMLQMLSQDYRFYLAFENALCKDYVSEKVFRKLMIADVVPIVRGHVNYTKFLPPKSFINVDNFAKVADLARYLKYLESNITAYTEYLEWKRYYFAIEKPNPTCEICMKLTEPERYARVYKDVYSWWETGMCHPPRPIV